MNKRSLRSCTSLLVAFPLACVALVGACKHSGVSDGSDPKAIFGKDARVPVTNPTEYPYSTIVELEANFGGYGYFCTGFFVRPGLVLTDALCVYDHDHGGWATWVDVKAPRCGTIRAAKFLTNEAWTANREVHAEFAVIRMPSTECGTTSGFLGVLENSGASLDNRVTEVAGYSHKRGFLKAQGRVASDQYFLYYLTDTSDGYSGAPVFLPGEEPLVVGIHLDALDSANRAARFQPASFNRLLEWVEMSGGGAGGSVDSTSARCDHSVVMSCPSGSFDGCLVPGLTNRPVCVSNRSRDETRPCSYELAAACDAGFTDACGRIKASDKHLCVLQ